MRSIDADAIYDTLSDIFIEHLATSSNTDTRNALDSLYHTVLSAVETAPTIYHDEVRGVVHCCECKYAMHRTPVGIKTEILCDLFNSGTKKDDYCSYGKTMEVTNDA